MTLLILRTDHPPNMALGSSVLKSIYSLLIILFLRRVVTGSSNTIDVWMKLCSKPGVPLFGLPVDIILVAGKESEARDSTSADSSFDMGPVWVGGVLGWPPSDAIKSLIISVSLDAISCCTHKLFTDVTIS